MFKKYEDILKENNIKEIHVGDAIDKIDEKVKSLQKTFEDNVLLILEAYGLNSINYKSQLSPFQSEWGSTAIKTSYFSKHSIRAFVKIIHDRNENDIPTKIKAIDFKTDLPDGPVAIDEVFTISDLSNELSHMSKLMAIFQIEKFRDQYAQIVEKFYIQYKELVDEKNDIFKKNDVLLHYKGGKYLGQSLKQTGISSYDELKEYLETLSKDDRMEYFNMINNDTDLGKDKKLSKEFVINTILKYVCV